MLGELLELRRLLQRRTLAPEQLRALQEEKLRAVIHHSYEHVPYYRDLFTSAGLRPRDIGTLEDLKHIPVTTKDHLRDAGIEQVTARNFDHRFFVRRRTGGSTGHPFTVYLTSAEARTRRLIAFRTILSIGLRPWDRLTVLGPQEAPRPRLHQRLGLYRRDEISPFLPPAEQVRRLQALRPTVLLAYPTLLMAVIREVEDRLSRVIRPRTLITAAESLDETTREHLREDLQAEIFNFYGAVEVGPIAADCPAHQGLHLDADHVILECPTENRTAESGGPCIVTALSGFAMPFIRYRLGDLCQMIEQECPCGSRFPLIAAPYGRDDDMITLPSGALLSPMALRILLRDCDWIRQYRVVQERVDHLLVQVAPRGHPPEGGLVALRERIEARLREPLHVEIQCVESLQDDTRKFRSFISHVSARSPSPPAPV